MKAVAIDKPNRLTVTTLDDPIPGPYEMVVKVDDCGICGTDIHVLEGDFAPTRYPIVPGHEFCGEVVAIGSGVSNVRLGDLVAVEVLGRSVDHIARDGGTGLARWTTAYLHNGLARYDVALAAAEQVAQNPHELWFSPRVMVELIEAATRSGRNDRAARALDVLSEMTRASGTPWARGIEARSRALLAEGEAAETLYRKAIEHFGPTGLRVDLARTHLLYGEWLRRERRRIDARTQLRTAYELFSQLGMEAFAERARVELEATGEHARKRTVETRDDLTPQEAQISRLAAEGQSNREIAARLFISPSTVEYHLKKVFSKLDIKSRTQLARRLSHVAVGS